MLLCHEMMMMTMMKTFDHKKKKNMVYEFKCPLCHKRFTHVQQLHRHKRLVHPPSNN